MKEKELKLMLERFVYPEKFVDISDWFTGDGPYEEYCNKLYEEAEKLLEETI